MKILYATLIIVVLDQITKLAVKGFNLFGFKHEGMFEGERIPVIGDFARLTFIENPGMAFGYDPGSSLKMWLTIFTLVACIAMFIFLYKIKDHNFLSRLSLALLLGGALGNFIDRAFYGVFYDYAPLFYGKVVDFIDIDFFDVTIFGRHYDRWPIFNVADMSVSFGVIMLMFFYKHKTEEEQPKEIIDNIEVRGATENLPQDTPTEEEKSLNKEE